MVGTFCMESEAEYMCISLSQIENIIVLLYWTKAHRHFKEQRSSKIIYLLLSLLLLTAYILFELFHECFKGR